MHATTAALDDPTRLDAEGRPTVALPLGQLVRLSLYWLGLSSIFSGVQDILTGRLQFTGLVPRGSEGAAVFQMIVFGTVIAMLVQPTIGTISDYTQTRWGRRKPYILIGSLLDVVFLYGIATSNTVVSIAAFFVLLQFSSNFAQGPFQGYVPDLVPARQVGLASALVGLFQVLGNVTGFAIAALALFFSESVPDAFLLGTMALGLVELATMLSVLVGVREGRTAKDRGGRSWLAIAREAWGTDILRERSFLWLVGSRLLVLMGSSMLVQLSTFYLAQSHALDAQATASVKIALLALVTASIVLSVVPSARASDRFGRKPVIYVSCVVGTAGLLLVAAAPVLAVAFVGAALVGVSSGIFLAVDWALMTDIIPKASSGRYMGLSNVATASAGILAVAFGAGLIMDSVNSLAGYGIGPRAAMLFGAASFVLGALLLIPVDERRRAESPAQGGATEEVSAPATS